ncbi:glycoside hydrolase family 88 protein [Paenactinomyces guangxiensis]|uniref:Glycoside hydrolase family 88 protein n=1 Tax=Paenactinomyces guangxiensis TaxID=1490290 RepID=A0A7W1WPZ2_9BACL|nr:glycoside hydrolase family 88 protein [Paenactinomyces guangxiensis]MBA4493784.1 glycoside hydrolase family 88 protein [Paenactinomyces guangxiensis]MBH8591073.1 glycoside hydrolase family 88 protein [Paenactinomyces guangxiensis]
MPKLIFDEDEIRKVIDRVVHRTFRMDFNWDWPAGVAFYGVAEAYGATGRTEYLDLLKDWVDEKLEDGLPRLSINGVAIGHSLLSLYQATGDEKYIDIATQMADFLKNDAERFADGVFQHTVNSETYNFPEQAWVDTMMMAGYFLIRIGSLLDREDYFEDGLKQYHGHENFLQDSVTNLYYHGWDNIAQNHMSGVFWARGNAWAALTMAKALDIVHVTHPSFMIIDGSLRDQLAALVRLQSETGLWHTVLTDPASYLETSGSAGIATALLSRGSLYNKYVQKSIQGILEQITKDGTVTRVSAGTAVMRDVQGYKDVPCKRIQGWGQGLTLAFLSALLNTGKRVFD